MNNREICTRKKRPDYVGKRIDPGVAPGPMQ